MQEVEPCILNLFLPVWQPLQVPDLQRTVRARHSSTKADRAGHRHSLPARCSRATSSLSPLVEPKNHKLRRHPLHFK